MNNAIFVYIAHNTAESYFAFLALYALNSGEKHILVTHRYLLECCSVLCMATARGMCTLTLCTNGRLALWVFDCPMTNYD
jgi:hypothetical protein